MLFTVTKMMYALGPEIALGAHCWSSSPPAPRMRSLSPSTLGLWSRVSRSARRPLPHNRLAGLTPHCLFVWAGELRLLQAMGCFAH
jgi:hypothetical protein